MRDTRYFGYNNEKARDKIPKNKKVRLLYQPAEEGPGGAKQMIEEGCLDGVDEVYGYHNVPNFDEGDIQLCSLELDFWISKYEIRL